MATEFNLEHLQQQMKENFVKGADFYQERNFPKAIEYLQKALGTCEILNDLQMKKEILYFLGHTYQLRNTELDYQLAEDCYNELLALEGASEKYFFQIQYNRAVSLVDRGEYEEGIKLFNEIHSEEEGYHLDARTTEAYAYFCLGKFTDPAYYKEAIKHCEKIVSLADRKKDTKALYYAYHNLGHVYYELNENIKAILAFQDSLEFCLDQDSRHENYVDMALVFVRFSQYDLARGYIDKAQHYFEKSKKLLGLAACLFAKGKLYRQKGKVDESANYLELALSGYREKEYNYGIVKTLYELYELYRKVNIEKAELYYDQYQFYMNYVSPMGAGRGEYVEEDDPIWI